MKIFLLTCSDGRVNVLNFLDIQSDEIFYYRTPGASLNAIESPNDYLSEKAAIAFSVLDLNIKKFAVLSHKDCRAHNALHKYQAENSDNSKMSKGESLLAKQLLNKKYDNIGGVLEANIKFEVINNLKNDMCSISINAGLESLVRIMKICREVISEYVCESSPYLITNAFKDFSFDLFYDSLDGNLVHVGFIEFKEFIESQSD